MSNRQCYRVCLITAISENALRPKTSRNKPNLIHIHQPLPYFYCLLLSQERTGHELLRDRIIEDTAVVSLTAPFESRAPCIKKEADDETSLFLLCALSDNPSEPEPRDSLNQPRKSLGGSWGLGECLSSQVKDSAPSSDGLLRKLSQSFFLKGTAAFAISCTASLIQLAMVQQKEGELRVRVAAATRATARGLRAKLRPAGWIHLYSYDSHYSCVNITSTQSDIINCWT